MRFFFFLLTGSLLFSLPSMARPVSYPGGWTFTTTNDSNANTMVLHYSPSAGYSIGYRLEYKRDEHMTLNALQSNILLKRWNGPNSQSNLYLKNGAGIGYSDHGTFDRKAGAVIFSGIAADWENRRFFASYENRGTISGTFGNDFAEKARAGIAPYIGDYGDLHTWLMLEVQHFPQRADHFRIAPLVRLFKGVGLAEAGIDNKGDALLNFTYRF